MSRTASRPQALGLVFPGNDFETNAAWLIAVLIPAPHLLDPTFMPHWGHGQNRTEAALGAVAAPGGPTTGRRSPCFDVTGLALRSAPPALPCT